MPQFFQPQTNRVLLGVLLAIPVALTAALGAAVWAGRADFITGKGATVEQPVSFPHDIHAGKLQIDCRFCHEHVERSPFAGLPSSAVCLDCHAQVWTGLAALEPVRAAAATGLPLAWRRVHDVPDYARFDHSIHSAKGVGCVACHGRADQMTVMKQTETLLMTWCLDCHRDPIPHIQPRETICDPTWKYPSGIDELNALARDLGVEATISRPRDLQEALADAYDVREKLSCSICHQ